MIRYVYYLIILAKLKGKELGLREVTLNKFDACTNVNREIYPLRLVACLSYDQSTRTQRNTIVSEMLDLVLHLTATFYLIALLT